MLKNYLCFKGWIIFSCTWTPCFLCPFICWRTSKLFLHLGYCDSCCSEHGSDIVSFWDPNFSDLRLMPETGFQKASFLLSKGVSIWVPFSESLPAPMQCTTPGQPCPWPMVYNGCPKAVQCPAPLSGGKIQSCQFEASNPTSLCSWDFSLNNRAWWASFIWFLMSLALFTSLKYCRVVPCPVTLQDANRWKILWGGTRQAPCWR